MTVEQLNVIITAQTDSFEQKINAVNKSLEQTLELAKASANSIAGISVETGESTGFTRDFARTAELSENYSESNSSNSPLSFNIPAVSGAAANVLALRHGETLIGAMADGNSDNASGIQRPIEIHTTVELDGEKVGESVGLYNSARRRVTNGRE
ncbi:MAG: hypothetical protein IJ385_04335 [Ruminiclostridium sp.]|nr:hypothetical protein [Ruminiclostridium sp.]